MIKKTVNTKEDLKDAVDQIIYHTPSLPAHIEAMLEVIERLDNYASQKDAERTINVAILELLSTL